MKLCEIVFECHHNPTAMRGIDGAANNAAPCANAAQSAKDPTQE
jgi:hypothetical protein